MEFLIKKNPVAVVPCYEVNKHFAGLWKQQMTCFVIRRSLLLSLLPIYGLFLKCFMQLAYCLLYFFRSYHISCPPNAFLEKEDISSEKNNEVHFSTTYILCIENKLKTRPTDIKLLITIANYRYNYQCTF